MVGIGTAGTGTGAGAGAGTGTGTGGAARDPEPAPLVVDIKRNALDDGPGIRTVVFFKGCPLRCAWCQNPEAISVGPDLQWEAARCVGCGACAVACPRGLVRPPGEAGPPWDRSACDRCGACADACPSGARRIVGVRRTLDELEALLTRDAPFYRRSGGGVTLSGGEPALFPAFAGELARRLTERGIHVLAETSGDLDWDDFAAHLLPHLAAIYVDVKLADPEAHRAHTGRDGRRIRETLTRLAALATSATAGRPEVLPRVPLIPDLTATETNLRGVAALLRHLGYERVALLPYNPLWLPKRRSLGLDPAYTHERWMTPEDIARCRRVVEAAGLAVVAR